MYGYTSTNTDAGPPLSTDAVEIVVVEADSVTALMNDIVLIFLRYKRDKHSIYLLY